MGIKRKIVQNQLPLKYQKYKLIETEDGLTHSVYLLENKYVLKIVDDISLQNIDNEKNLLNDLETLCVPRIVDVYEKNDYTMIFYTQMDGISLLETSNNHIKQIAIFLKSFHAISRGKSSSNIMIYEKAYFKNLILETKNTHFLNYFHDINCELKNDGIIHGDLFCDNAKFKNDKLSGVYDFIEACEGDFIFDLAVVVISWCFKNNTLEDKKVEILLKTYDLEISFDTFKEYIKYALLYYTTTRYLNNENYDELLQRLKSL